MTRFLTRQNVKLVIVAGAVLLLAWTGPSVAHGVHAQFAHNADKVDGKHAVSSGASLTRAKKKLVAHNNKGQLPDKFVAKPGKIVTAAGGLDWTPNSAAPPATFQIFTVRSRAAGNGVVQTSLQGPVALGSAKYGLKSVTLCYNGTGGGFITSTTVFGIENTTAPTLATDPTDRTSPTQTCYTVPVGKRVTNGANVTVSLSGGGTVDLYAVRATWTQGAATVAPRSVAGGGTKASRGEL